MIDDTSDKIIGITFLTSKFHFTLQIIVRIGLCLYLENLVTHYYYQQSMNF